MAGPGAEAARVSPRACWMLLATLSVIDGTFWKRRCCVSFGAAIVAVECAWERPTEKKLGGFVRDLKAWPMPKSAAIEFACVTKPSPAATSIGMHAPFVSLKTPWK